MHALILAAALVAAPNPSTDKAAAADACKPPQTTRTAERGAPPGPRKLTELPDARLMRTVIRTVGDCYVAEVKTATGEWRYEPDGRKPEALWPTTPNPYVQPLR